MPRVDLLFCSGKLKYETAIQDVEELVIEGIKIPFAGIDSLIQSKETDRAKDLADLEILRNIQDHKKNNSKN